MIRFLRHPVPALPAASVVALLVLAALLGPAPSAAADTRPTAVVALGDSAASGDGAGDYEAGTRGEGGDWCHRSAHAYVHRTGLPGESINLACSGADSAAVAFGGTHNTEGSQAQRLGEVAGRFRVTTVVLQVGANDDAALTATGIACIRAFVDARQPPCRDTIGPQAPARMAATGAKVEGAVRDVREAMRRAGYADNGYELVLVSYAAPVTDRMVPVQAAQGCPYSRADAGWGRTVLFPALSATIAGVAERTGARFLDMVRATEGREACSHALYSEEWQRRITVDPEALVHGGLDAIGFHLAQESFHPTAAAHAEMGRCLGDFVRAGAVTASCVAGPDGRDRLAPAAPAAAPGA
ncbi:GDSL-type esterase/lipase family protein [Pseudonocardia xinjiangensis]|uniref:GDSL-type esterase/lipase family protein n=1 Tax=Pseudonocardia xinjiangensis TaxID=75289 RepID=UPI003D921EF7